MKKIFLIIVFVVFNSIYFVQAHATSPNKHEIILNQNKDVILEIATHFKNSNSKEIASYFSSNVNFSLLNKENSYSSAQTEIILDNFLKSNQPNNVKIIHRLDGQSNYQHAVIQLSTYKGEFRVAYSLKGSSDDLKLIEIRIEKIEE